MAIFCLLNLDLISQGFGNFELNVHTYDFLRKCFIFQTSITKIMLMWHDLASKDFHMIKVNFEKVAKCSVIVQSEHVCFKRKKIPIESKSIWCEEQ